MSVAYGKLIDDLKRQLAEAQDKLGSFRGQRRPHALAAVGGDKQAQAKLAKIDEAANAARSEVDTLEVALEEAQAQAAEAERQATEDDLNRRRTEAAKHIDDILKADEQFDSLARQMTAVLSVRRDLIGELGRLDVMSASFVGGRHRKYLTSAAMRAAGLHAFADIEHVGPEHCHPLADADRCLIAQGPASETVAEEAEAA